MRLRIRREEAAVSSSRTQRSQGAGGKFKDILIRLLRAKNKLEAKK